MGKQFDTMMKCKLIIYHTTCKLNRKINLKKFYSLDYTDSYILLYLRSMQLLFIASTLHRLKLMPLQGLCVSFLNADYARKKCTPKLRYFTIKDYIPTKKKLQNKKINYNVNSARS